MVLENVKKMLGKPCKKFRKYCKSMVSKNTDEAILKKKKKN